MTGVCRRLEDERSYMRTMWRQELNNNKLLRQRLTSAQEDASATKKKHAQMQSKFNGD